MLAFSHDYFYNLYCFLYDSMLLLYAMRLDEISRNYIHVIQNFSQYVDIYVFYFIMSDGNFCFVDSFSSVWKNVLAHWQPF